MKFSYRKAAGDLQSAGFRGENRKGFAAMRSVEGE
jgi:hypothetical protein